MIKFVFITQQGTGTSLLNVKDKSVKIIGGTSVTINQTAYQASIRLKSLEETRGFGGGHICGGTVITQRLVVTAAHCVILSKHKLTVSRSPKELIVVMGSVILNYRSPETLVYNVQAITAHSNFDSTSLENDIALIFLSGYIPWNWPTVRAIPLNMKPIRKKTFCKVSGWGLTANGVSSPVLLGATVPVIPNLYCFKAYGYLPATMLCAGYMVGGIDACQGDSGGPLQCNNLLVGIVSWGNGCAERNYPGIYTNVAAYRDWIIRINNTLNYTDFSRAPNLIINITTKFIIIANIFYALNYSFKYIKFFNI